MGVTKDSEPHRWGAGGPGVPGHGQVVESMKARADLVAGAFVKAALKLDLDCYSEPDEGDYDSYYNHKLFYKDEEIWSFSTSSHVNIGGCWGTSSSVAMNGDMMTVGLTHCGRRVGGGHDSTEERQYSLKDILIGAAIKAGANAPLKPGEVLLR